ncbi:MAG TPA: hypothetical protein P5081_05510 [Phycisphaerae bacterium]|nr:hypothetical protein [Phycisphaerae bacterium]HRW52324.1 hypothetical protein [Phycisphaerae bacterium]
MTHHAPKRAGLSPKRRRAIIDQWRVQMIRNGGDQIALEQVRQRAIQDPLVREDPDLRAQIEQCVAERSREIAVSRSVGPHESAQDRFRRHTQFGAHEPSLDDVMNIVQHLRLQAKEQLAREDEIAAGFTLSRLEALRRRFPNLVDIAVVQELTSAHRTLHGRRMNVMREIQAATTRAINAALTGDHDDAAAAMRQIAAHHIAHPDLLNDDAMDRIRERVSLATAKHEHEDAAAELMRREREVSAELRALSSAIQGFRKVARQSSHDSDAYHAAERAYLKAVRDIRRHDREWLAGVILELVSLLDDWTDHPRGADRQVDGFVNTLRASLHDLHHDVRLAERTRRRA